MVQHLLPHDYVENKPRTKNVTALRAGI